MAIRRSRRSPHETDPAASGCAPARRCHLRQLLSRCQRGRPGATSSACAKPMPTGRKTSSTCGAADVGRSHLLQAACLRWNSSAAARCTCRWPSGHVRPASCSTDLEHCDLVALHRHGQIWSPATRTWEVALFQPVQPLARCRPAPAAVGHSAPPREVPIKLPGLSRALAWRWCSTSPSLTDDEKLRALQLRASRRGLHLSPTRSGRLLPGTRGSRGMSALFDLLDQLDQASLQAQRKLTIPFVKETLGW